MTIDDVPEVLKAVLGSSKPMDIVFFDEDDDPEDLSAATTAAFSLCDGDTVIFSRSTADGDLSIDAANSKLVVDAVTDDELLQTAVLTDIVSSTKTLTLSGDLTNVPAMQAGGTITIESTGLTDSANAGTYTVVSSALNGGDTDVVVEEDLSSDETTIVGIVTFEPAVKPGRYTGYASVRVSSNDLKSEPFYVDLIESKASSP